MPMDCFPYIIVLLRTKRNLLKPTLKVLTQGISSGGGELDIRWRAHVICWAAQNALRLKGDFVECGVNTGICSLLAMNYIDFQLLSDRKWYLLDTYCGLVDGQGHSKEHVTAVNKSYPDCYELAKKNFSPYSNAVLIRGVIPDTLPQVPSEKIVYLHIDLNCAYPEIEAAKFFWDKLVTGAIIVLDDYAYSGYTKQKEAWDIFAHSKGYSVLSLPTGQGMLVK